MTGRVTTIIEASGPDAPQIIADARRAAGVGDDGPRGRSVRSVVLREGGRPEDPNGAQWSEVESIVSHVLGRAREIRDREEAERRDRHAAGFDALRAEAMEARAALEHAVADACGEGHKPTQHRDARPPWCRRCGMTADGRIAAGIKREGRDR